MPVAPYPYLLHPAWTWILWSSFAAFFVVTSWAHQRDRGGSAGENRDRGSKMLIYVLSFAGAFGAFATPWLVPSARIALPPAIVFFVAMGLLWAGLLLYLTAILTLGAFFRTSVTLLDGQKLITSGPYRIVRHPAYTGGILVFAGVGLNTGNWVGLAVSTLAVASAYMWRIHVEEQALVERFGDAFLARRKSTWAVIPFIW